MKWKNASLNAYLSFMFILQLEEDEATLSVAHERLCREGKLTEPQPQPEEPISQTLNDYRIIKQEYLSLLVQLNELVHVEVNGARHLIHFSNLEQFVAPFDQDKFTWWPTNFRTFEEAEQWKNEQIRSFYLSDDQIKALSAENRNDEAS